MTSSGASSTCRICHMLNLIPGPLPFDGILASATGICCLTASDLLVLQIPVSLLLVAIVVVPTRYAIHKPASRAHG